MRILTVLRDDLTVHYGRSCFVAEPATMKLLLHLGFVLPKRQSGGAAGINGSGLLELERTRARVTIQHDFEDFGDASVPRIP